MPVVPFIPAVLGAGASLYTAKRARESSERAVDQSVAGQEQALQGATPASLGRNAQNAFMQSYNNQLQGLSSFARTPLNTAGIANTMSGIGNTYAQGSIAQGQINQGMYGDLANAAGSGLRAFLSRTPTHTSPANQLTDAQIAGRIQL